MLSDNNKRIAKNTLMLYTRQILTLGVSLYTVRVALNVLGITDYGIYNVIGGIVALFTFLSGSMAAATQRFFSFAIGQNDEEQLKKTFTSNWILYGAIALIALILLESVGLWFVNNRLNVPPDRLVAAQWLYQFSILSFIAIIVSTPFTAMIIAHEDMHIYAYVSIVEALLKLGAVVLLIFVPWNKLELFGVLNFMAMAVRTCIYLAICSRKYSECQFRKFYWDRKILREVVGFTSWSLLGRATTVGRIQGVTILLNQFFSPAVVAARAISANISGQINIFSQNFNTGLYPPIIKSYAANDKAQMFSLIINGSKITFFLMWFFALPLFLEMPIILKVWLSQVPPDAVLFSRLGLVEVLINAISLPISTAARAPGRLMLYELTLGFLQLMLFVAAWIALKAGYPAYSVYIIAIAVNVVMFFVRLWIVKGLIDLPVMLFIRQSVLPMSAITVLSATPSILVHVFLPGDLLYRGLSVISCMAISLFCMYYLGLNKVWRKKVRDMVMVRVKKLTQILPV